MLLRQGVELLIYGMGTVVVFLSLLVIATRLLSVGILRFCPDPEPLPGPEPADASAGPGAPSAEVLAAIAAALHRHRSRER